MLRRCARKMGLLLLAPVLVVADRKLRRKGEPCLSRRPRLLDPSELAQSSGKKEMGAGKVGVGHG